MQQKADHMSINNQDSIGSQPDTTKAVASEPDVVKQEIVDTSDETATLKKVPTDVEKWNDYLKSKKFDPFDKVVLVKGIDNSILTSFRTLKG